MRCHRYRLHHRHWPPSCLAATSCSPLTHPRTLPSAAAARSGADTDLTDARRAGEDAATAVLRTQLGTFFLANLAAACCCAVAGATKTLFLGQLTTGETTKLAEVRRPRRSAAQTHRPLACVLGLDAALASRVAVTVSSPLLLPPLLLLQRLIKFMMLKAVFLATVPMLSMGDICQASLSPGRVTGRVVDSTTLPHLT